MKSVDSWYKSQAGPFCPNRTAATAAREPVRQPLRLPLCLRELCVILVRPRSNLSAFRPSPQARQSAIIHQYPVNEKAPYSAKDVAAPPRSPRDFPAPQHTRITRGCKSFVRVSVRHLRRLAIWPNRLRRKSDLWDLCAPLAHLCVTSLLLFASLALQTARAADTRDPAPLFVAGQDGYHTYRIPALVTSTKATLLAFCEGRRQGSGDTGEIHTLLKRSTDGGATWSPQQTVWADGANACGNPAPVVDEKTGTIWLLLTWNLGADREDQIMKGTSKDTRRAFVTSSTDDGQTWAKPREITDSVKKTHWRWYATGPVNGIQLQRGPHAGRLVVPANHSDHSDPAKHPYRSHVIYSDDHGATWKLGGIEDEKTNESTLVELVDGTLLHNMRSYHGKNRRAIARSRDGGLTWSKVELDDSLVEPVCQASMLRHSWPANGKPGIILFLNPASTRRERMLLRTSQDEAATWSAGELLHEGPAAYSALSTLPDGSIACLYEAGTKNAYESIVFIRKFL